MEPTDATVNAAESWELVVGVDTPAYHQALTSESSRHKAREETLAQITASRISWTRKLDEFVDVVNRGALYNVPQCDPAQPTAGCWSELP